MGRIVLPPPVKLIAGLIFREPEILERAEASLTEKFGPVDVASSVTPFTHTEYYHAEFGPNLKRKFIGFKQGIAPDSLPAIKVETNDLESRLAGGPDRNRMINIDPGYLAPEKMVLATTKNRDHRPYLQSGIYAEPTYRFFKGSYVPFDWSYPDYREPDTIAMFNRWRKLHFQGEGT
jgi:hypothetical protein